METLPASCSTTNSSSSDNSALAAESESTITTTGATPNPQRTIGAIKWDGVGSRHRFRVPHPSAAGQGGKGDQNQPPFKDDDQEAWVTLLLSLLPATACCLLAAAARVYAHDCDGWSLWVRACACACAWYDMTAARCPSSLLPPSAPLAPAPAVRSPVLCYVRNNIVDESIGISIV